MPKAAKPARLHLRKGAQRSEAIYYIRDGLYECSTRTGSREEAEKILANYLLEKGRQQNVEKATGRTHLTPPQDVTVSEVLGHYILLKKDTKYFRTIEYALKPLLPFWGDLKMSDISNAACRNYVAQRGVKDSTARRELGILQAAINYCGGERIIAETPQLKKPSGASVEKRHLTRTEAYWLLRGARLLETRARSQVTKFIIAGYRTGTRKEVLLNTRLDKRTKDSAFLNLKTGVYFRSSDGEVATKKRKPTIAVPSHLHCLARLWAKNGSTYLVDTNKHLRVDDLKNGFATAVRLGEELARKKGHKVDLSGTTPHILRHTAITWAMQKGTPVWIVQGYFGVTQKMIDEVYAHHHPDFMAEGKAAMENKNVFALR